MKVEVLNYKGELVNQLSDIDSKVGELVDYTNGITGKPDPQVVFAPDRWVHLSTLQAQGNRVRNAKTKEVVRIPNLSPCGWGME